MALLSPESYRSNDFRLPSSLSCLAAAFQREREKGDGLENGTDVITSGGPPTISYLLPIACFSAVALT
jgi:hypothetical protein